MVQQISFLDKLLEEKRFRNTSLKHKGFLSRGYYLARVIPGLPVLGDKVWIPLSTPNHRGEASSYEADCERVAREIWSTVNVKNLLVIDFGVGDSTKKLVELGAKVVGVDISFEKLIEISHLGIPLMKCSITEFPFRRRIADLTVFYFTLHEINPSLHEEAIRTAHLIAPKIMIVEPAPQGCPLYRQYARIWREAMHSINKYEDYKPLSYWRRLVEENSYKIVVSREIEWRISIPQRVLEKIVWDTAREWGKQGVDSKYINKLKELLKQAEKQPMKWSNIIVIVGEEARSGA